MTETRLYKVYLNARCEPIIEATSFEEAKEEAFRYASENPVEWVYNGHSYVEPIKANQKERPNATLPRNDSL
jgi:hypothetical protein